MVTFGAITSFYLTPVLAIDVTSSNFSRLAEESNGTFDLPLRQISKDGQEMSRSSFFEAAVNKARET